MAFEAYAPSDNLRSLSLQYYHLDAISAGFTLPHLEALSINEVFASTETFRDILRLRSTPHFRKLSLIDNVCGLATYCPASYSFQRHS
ncbi:hypothetical protein Rt10032_c05g2205 [Rhodotorula toruloides]|uniref:Uncharacterized protein n=1 Tax=Rhodotorula toruloides TaxID=5286 RepID=A0A511KCT5_RHOTO|nr:hypothetical protein Rt10032_c05g2205 [Rhodotorula toruloides]